jgi:hypothetical protein
VVYLFPLTQASMYWTADLAKFHSVRQKLINLVLAERSLCIARIGFFYHRISECFAASRRRTQRGLGECCARKCSGQNT